MAPIPSAGRYVKQLTGYRAFIPGVLPPNPPITVDSEMLTILSRADRALGRLDGVSSVLPNPDLFVAMFVRHEAVLSSQIEGTQSTLEDVLAFEAAETAKAQPKDVEEVVNYVRAMNSGLSRLKDLPLSLRLLREIHAELMHGVRGGEKTPGEFRRTQNWIGGHGATLATATFVPPPPDEMTAALGNLEAFLHDRSLPTLIHCGIAHAQFETIHPFLDGNGRVGRLLITLLLCEQKVLARPLLYLSYYLKLHRQEYYDRLMAIRFRDDWVGWLKFFLRGVAEVSEYSTATARNLLAMRDNHRAMFNSSATDLQFIDILIESPVLNINTAAKRLDVSYVTARNVVERFVQGGLLKELTGRARNKIYRYQPFVDIFRDQYNATPAEAAPAQLTI